MSNFSAQPLQQLWQNSRFWLITAGFVLIKLLLHFLTSTHYELHRDEMLYFNMSEHLALGYASVPPAIGIVAWLSKALFGFSVFGIRFFPALAGAIQVILIALIIRQLKGGIIALVVAELAFVLSCGFLLFDSLFTPNVFEQLCWLWIGFLFLKMTVKNDPKYWMWIGMLAGISFLFKYSVVLPMAAFMAGLALSKHRRLYNSRYLALAIITGALIISPNIYWQFAHGWPVMNHMKELNETQMVNIAYGNYFTDLFSLNSLSTFLWIFGLFGLLFFKSARDFRHLGIASLLVLVVFFLLKGKPYYGLGMIPLLFAFGGFFLENHPKWMRWKIQYVLIFIIFISSLFTLPLGLPVLKIKAHSAYAQRFGIPATYPFSRWEDGKVHPVSQVYADMTGWRQLASIVEEAYCQLTPEEQEQCTIYAVRNYGYAGAVNFYGHKAGLPQAITLADSYILWAPDEIPEGPLIYINMNEDNLTDLFEEVSLVGKVDDPFFRESGLQVFLCRIPKVDVQAVYREQATLAKAAFRR